MIVVLGGFGNLSAPWLGSILIVGSSEYFRFLGHYREIAYGIIILIVLIFMPQGIWGTFSAIIRKVIARLK
jgi:branched-chain amino acid transport system permease protein